MYCKNCGRKLENDIKDVCTECEIALNNGPIKQNINNENVNYTSSNVNSSSQVEHGKSRVAAGIFAIFFGTLGVHNFYLGYTGKAVAQLLITLLSFGLLSFATGIWAFIEAILILTGEIDKDAHGNLLRGD